MNPATNGTDPVIPPDKIYFRIGEVSEITQIPTYVLRFWETEFNRIKPKRTSSGQRLYKKADVELVFKIKRLLHDKKYTIRGAKQFLLAERRENQHENQHERQTDERQKNENKDANQKTDSSHIALIKDLRAELMDIRKLLD